MKLRHGLLTSSRRRAARWGGFAVATATSGVLLATPAKRADLARRSPGGDGGHRGDTPAAAADHRPRDRDPPAVDLAAGRPALGRGRRQLRRHLPASLLRRAAFS